MRPFEPIEVALSDGRSVIIRHPDQVVVSERHLIVGVAQVRRTRLLSTPSRSESIAKDWLLVNLVHIVTGEPTNCHRPSNRVKRR